MQKAMTDLPAGSAARVLANEGVTRPATVGVEDVLADADANRGKASFMDYVRFAVVAWYLSVVLTWLILSRQLPLNISIRRVLRRMLFMRIRHPVLLTGIEPQTGHCFRAKVSPRIGSDSDDVSRVRIYEDDKPLPMAHVAHLTIAELGLGRFSHWDSHLYFSSSDNTDPRTNGRKYTFKEI